MRARRFIPSLSQLLAFEAVVRHQSVTIAAKEMSLTQSTVTRLLQNLEGQVGQSLFIRERKRLVPTDAAKAYCLDITNALNMIQRASMGLMTNPDGGSLSLAVLPTFGTRWLAPRLAPFLQANPGITVSAALQLRRGKLRCRNFLRTSELAARQPHEAV
jgi:LysR family glycine cleavage system transcriptional activator